MEFVSVAEEPTNDGRRRTNGPIRRWSFVEFWRMKAMTGRTSRRTVGAIGLAAILTAVLIHSEVGGQAYSIDRVRGRVLVDRRSHWEGWAFPSGVLEITPQGEVRPIFIRSNINAALDAMEFVHAPDVRGGISDAGSNLRDAENLIDGDPQTFWEPDPKDPLRDWWVAIDLGRLVSATRVVFRFVEEGEGDPFKQFTVFISDGQLAFKGAKELSFWVIGRTTKSNRDQRVFEFEPFPQKKSEITGAPLQYLQIEITDSDFGRAEQISKESYDALGSADRGDIVYFRKTPSGEELISEDGYDALPADRRGSIQYYRRERPRLAEVEVWSIGDNISLRIKESGGSMDVTGFGQSFQAFDGDYMTKWDAPGYNLVRDLGRMVLDLGTTFWVDRIRIITRIVESSRELLLGYETRASDGSTASDGSLLWETLTPDSRLQNTEQALLFEDRFPIRKIRYLDFKNVDISGVRVAGVRTGYGWVGGVAEFQIFGKGYVPEVAMESGLIELGGSRNLVSMEWDADTPPDTRVEIQTRTGAELIEVKRFYDKGGAEVTERSYNRLPGSRKGEIKIEYLPGGGWSPWSPAYVHSGERFKSPSPRKYTMIRARLMSDDPGVFPTLKSVVMNFVQPVAQEVVAEISPEMGVSPGYPEDFTLILKPTFTATDPGFDEILVESPLGTQMELLGVGLGKEEDLLAGVLDEFVPDAEGLFRDPAGRVLEVLQDRSDSLRVRLPSPLRLASGAQLVGVRFRSTVFLNGTVFETSVAHSGRRNSTQRVDDGDATLARPGLGTTVFVRMSEKIVDEVAVEPNPFTPNGDGVNDLVTFHFSVFKVNTDKPAEVRIYDLNGREIRRLLERRPRASGRYAISWSGDDETGRTVSPGLYLARISVDVDEESVEHRAVSRVVGVAY